MSARATPAARGHGPPPPTEPPAFIAATVRGRAGAPGEGPTGARQRRPGGVPAAGPAPSVPDPRRRLAAVRGAAFWGSPGRPRGAPGRWGLPGGTEGSRDGSECAEGGDRERPEAGCRARPLRLPQVWGPPAAPLTPRGATLEKECDLQQEPAPAAAGPPRRPALGSLRGSGRGGPGAVQAGGSGRGRFLSRRPPAPGAPGQSGREDGPCPAESPGLPG